MKWYMQGARQQNWMRECCPLHDPLAMIVAVNPSVVKTHRCVTRIECEGAYCKGMVVTDLREYPIDGEYVNHCMEVDSQKSFRHFVRGVLLKSIKKKENVFYEEEIK